MAEAIRRFDVAARAALVFKGSIGMGALCMALGGVLLVRFGGTDTIETARAFFALGAILGGFLGATARIGE